jgi:transposase InsO family protein
VCDNAGENKSFQSVLKKKQYIKFEHTAPNTPHQNGKIEKIRYSIWQDTIYP